jgi:hypothetical protein
MLSSYPKLLLAAIVGIVLPLLLLVAVFVAM